MSERAGRSSSFDWPLLLVALVCLGVGLLTLSRGMRFDFDFKHFYLDAEYVWRHGALNPVRDAADATQNRQLPFYLPAVPILLAPLAALGRGGAAVVWALGQVACAAYVLLAMRGWATYRGVEYRQAWGVAVLLGLPVLYEAARFNQLSLPILALVLAGTEALLRRREGLAGAALALAATVKLLPAVAVAWLLGKRAWGAVPAIVLTGAVLVIGIPALVLGPQAARAAYEEWWAENVGGAPLRGMTDSTLREHFIDHRNQSLPAVLGRWFDPAHPYRAPYQPLALREATCRRIAFGVLAVIAAAAAVALRRPAARLGADGLRAEAAACLLLMLVLTPLMRQYYLVWALPALCVLLTRAAALGSRAGLLGAALWVLGMLAWTSPAARSYGAHWFMVAALLYVLLSPKADRMRPSRLGVVGGGMQPRRRRH